MIKRFALSVLAAVAASIVLDLVFGISDGRMLMFAVYAGLNMAAGFALCLWAPPGPGMTSDTRLKLGVTVSSLNLLVATFMDSTRPHPHGLAMDLVLAVIIGTSLYLASAGDDTTGP